MKININTKNCNQHNVNVELHYYENGRIAIILTHNELGKLMVASVNIPEIKLDKNQVLIKNYSENEGILDELINNKIIEDTGITIPCGYVNAHLCNLLIEKEDD